MPSQHFSSSIRLLGWAPTLIMALPLLGSCQSDDPGELTDKERLGLYIEGALGYYAQGDLDRAQQQVEFGLKVDPKNERMLLLLGNIHQHRGTTADIQAAEAIFRDHPAQHDFRVQLGLGQALERMGVIYEDASAAIRSGDRVTDAIDPEERATELGRMATEAWQEAEESYRTTLSISTGDVGAIGGLLRVSALLGNEDQSILWGRDLIDVLNSSSRIRHLELEDATLSAQRERELRASIAGNDEMIVKTHMHISSILTKQGDLPGALDELGQVIDIDPDLPQAHSRRAQLYYDLKQYQRAADTLDSFLKLSSHLPFDHPDIRRAYDLLRKCKDQQ